jgi:Cu(I)/Ag(I) efflux system membrane protein CusA/SilA
MVKKFNIVSQKNRAIVLLVSACLFGWFYSVQENPLMRFPDSGYCFYRWMGRSPQVIEDQVTYPLVSNLQVLKSIRASSMFGMSFIYIILKIM